LAIFLFKDKSCFRGSQQIVNIFYTIVSIIFTGNLKLKENITNYQQLKNMALFWHSIYKTITQ